MTNSMLPYSFVPGTKAKASEVNANFISLATAIAENLASASTNFSEINTAISTINTTLAGKEGSFYFTVSESDTNLNDYMTKGIYFFSSSYVPSNTPAQSAGVLFVFGTASTYIKQVWLDSAAGEYSEYVYVRNHNGAAWSSWKPIIGNFRKNHPGYYKLPNGLVIQWGYQSSSSKAITYPIAFETKAVPVFQKKSCSTSDTTSDIGFTEQSLTGFTMNTSGLYDGMNWLAIGY